MHDKTISINEIIERYAPAYLKARDWAYSQFCEEFPSLPKRNLMFITGEFQEYMARKEREWMTDHAAKRHI